MDLPDDIVAERTKEVLTERGNRITVRVTVSRPRWRAESNSWECWYCFYVGGRDDRTRATGTDSMQALSLALDQAYERIETMSAVLSGDSYLVIRRLIPPTVHGEREKAAIRAQVDQWYRDLAKLGVDQDAVKNYFHELFAGRIAPGDRAAMAAIGMTDDVLAELDRLEKERENTGITDQDQVPGDG